MHLVALYEELVVLQASGRVHHLGPDVVVQVPVGDTMMRTPADRSHRTGATGPASPDRSHRTGVTGPE